MSDNYRQRTTAAQLLLLKLHGLAYVYVVEEIKLKTLGSISGTIFAIFKKYAVRPVFRILLSSIVYLILLDDDFTFKKSTQSSVVIK